MTNPFLKPCLCGGKPWFNIRKVICLKCGTYTKPFANFDESARLWNAMQTKVKA